MRRGDLGVKLNFNIDVNDFERGLDDLGRRQIPFAITVALTRTAQQARDEQYKQVKSIFDRPTPYTLNSLFVRPAKRNDTPPTAEVGYKSASAKGIAAARYLVPHTPEGGKRNDKRSEVALRRAGILPFGYQTRPGKGAKLDQHGNHARGEIVQILSALKAFGEEGYTANRTARSEQKARKSRRLREFVYLKERNGKAGGIFERDVVKKKYGTDNSDLTPILIFIREPRYKYRYPFQVINEQIAIARLRPNFRRALEEAIRTGRR
jgi:hypothetical protein